MLTEDKLNFCKREINCFQNKISLIFFLNIICFWRKKNCERSTHFDFLADILLYFSPARNTIVWIVFPSPISSPTMPPACWQWSSHSHCTPVCWYLKQWDWTCRINFEITLWSMASFIIYTTKFATMSHWLQTRLFELSSGSIGHFQVLLSLCFKMSLSVKPFI